MAYVWSSIADTNGENTAASNRDAFLKKLSQSDLKKARKLIKLCSEKPASCPDSSVSTEKSPPKVTKKPSTSDLKTRLLKLKELEKKGLITKEDAARKRNELLEKL